MKDFDIREYVWNIYELCNFHKLTNLNLALDMFIENLDIGYERYEGANLEYEKLYDIWANLPESYRAHEKMIFKKVLDNSYGKLCEAWNKKDKDNFTTICKSVRMKYGLKIE